jgi:hypothetical protein
MNRLFGILMGSGLAAAMLLSGAAAAPADDGLRWRPSKKVGKECTDFCGKKNFSNDVLNDNCKTQCEKAVKVYKKWIAKPCNDVNRGGCFGDVMSKSIGMLPAEHEAWVKVAEYGCKNK